MPWDKKTVDGKICVYKKTTGEVMHCYSGDGADEKANKYLAALYMHANEKDYKEWLDMIGVESAPSIYKEADGRYHIICVATAALKDREDELFETQAMDYDIAQAERTGEYPEFTMFHKSYLGIGRVEKMRRVGIFAVDEGMSYDDPFSLAVCKNILSTNDGTWRTSRGFYALETSGQCPTCGEDLVLNTKHMIIGFKCPTCGKTYLGYKGVLKEVHFRKTRTFEDTITDIPCVPFTGVSAFRSMTDNEGLEEFVMNKQQLKAKLLEGGVEEAVIDERLEKVTEKQLKQYDEIPMAKLLKELEIETDAEVKEEPDETADDGVEVVTLDEGVFNRLDTMMKQHIQEAFDGLEIEIPDAKEDALAEVTKQLTELKETVAELAEVVDALAQKDAERIKELMANTPRNAKFRVARFKAAASDDDSEDEDTEEMDEGEMPMHKPPKRKKHAINVEEGVVMTGDGQVFGSLSDSLFGDQ